MTNYFSKIRSLEARALQIYQILIGAAYNRQLLRYGDVADILGYKGAGVMDKMLGHIMFWCEQNDFPSLTVLVVNQETGLPGQGFTEASDINRERELVFDFDWFDVFPPTIEELKAAYKAADNAR